MQKSQRTLPCIGQNHPKIKEAIRKGTCTKTYRAYYEQIDPKHNYPLAGIPKESPFSDSPTDQDILGDSADQSIPDDPTSQSILGDSTGRRVIDLLIELSILDRRTDQSSHHIVCLCATAACFRGNCQVQAGTR